MRHIALTLLTAVLTLGTGCTGGNSATPADGSVGGDGATGGDGSACVDMCADGTKACQGNGVKTCALQANGCFDWSAVSPCDSQQYCDGGVCVGDCSDQCTDGARACEDDGYKVCALQASGCFGWGAVVPCGTTQICDQGSCRPACTDKCSEGTTSCDVTNGYKSCELQANGCYDWGAVTPCGSTQVCDQGQCRSNCVDACTPGTGLCDATGVRSCEMQGSGCYAWGTPTSCQGGQVCSGGRCADQCVDQCTRGAKMCVGAGTIECVLAPTGCNEWMMLGGCPAGNVCAAGACVSSCTDQCTLAATRCTATGLMQTCVTLPSGCRDWTLPTACASGQSCPNSGDHCVAVSCSPGDTRCSPTDPTVVETCTVSANWIPTMSCPQACQAGECHATTTCSPGAVRCNDLLVQTCNSSGTAWLYSATCNVGCSGGVCSDPCTPDATRCNGNTPETCNGAGTGWTAGTACTTSCWAGACIAADLVVDGVTVQLDGEHHYQNGVVVRNGGQIQVGPLGWLVLRAKTVSVDLASAIVATGVGTGAKHNSKTVMTCHPSGHSGADPSTYSTVGGGYGTKSTCNQTIYAADGCNCSVTDGDNTFGTTTQAEIEQGAKDAAGNLAGGMVAVYATESINLAGSIQANGTGNASGGGILLAADSLTVSGAVVAVGAGCGGKGRVKLLWGSAHSITGSVDAVRTDSVMPPLALTSGSHPFETRWYNDGLGDWSISWGKPFPTLNGYYVVANTSALTVPGPANATFTQLETSVEDASHLAQGTRYFHIASVDASFTPGTVENVLKVNVSTQPPSISSSSHPTQRTWYDNDALYLTWTNPQADANFTGYYYQFDHYADTVPSTTAGTFTTGKQILLSNLQPGIWVFHLVNRDTRNATTKAAAHFYAYIGTAPGLGNLSGSVFDGSNGNALLPGATISINRGVFSTTATTGTYTFNNSLYAGTWEVTASAPGYTPQKATVTVSEGQVTSQSFTLFTAP
jgi:hypothetical protein